MTDARVGLQTMRGSGTLVRSSLGAAGGTRTTRLLRNYRLRVLVCVLASVCNLARLPTQTVEVVGSAGAAVNARVPVSDYAGNVFYVNGGNEVIGNPTTPIVKPFLLPVSFLAPGADDAVPYFLSGNGNVT